MDYYLYHDCIHDGYTSWEYLGSRLAVAKSKARYTIRHLYHRPIEEKFLLCAMPDDEPFDIAKAEIIETLLERKLAQ